MGIQILTYPDSGISKREINELGGEQLNVISVSRIDKLITRVNSFSVSKRIIGALFILGFIVSLIPIIATMFFSVPVLDDYNFGARAHISYINGNGFWNGVFDNCTWFFYNWQGFFTANFIASSQPYVINESLYFISILVFFITFVFSLFYFFKTILIDILKVSVLTYIIVSIPIIEFIIQFLPSAAEGIYWMDGSLSMFITGLVLILISLIFGYENASHRKLIFITTCFLSAVLSGAINIDYITLLLLFIFAVIFYRKKKRVLSLVCVNFIILTFGVVISILAPGNAVRKSALSGFPIYKSILLAIRSSLELFGTWSSICFIISLIFISVILWNQLKKSSFNFKYPLLVFLAMYILYSSRMSLQYYSNGYLGSPRHMNQYFIGFVLCMTISSIYFTGWLSKRTKMARINSERISLALCLFICFVYFSGCLSYGIKDLNSVSTSISFIKAETQKYNKEMKERIKLYNDKEINQVKVKPLSCHPKFFMDDSIVSDPNFWTNDAVAKYYEKDSIILEEMINK